MGEGNGIHYLAIADNLIKLTRNSMSGLLLDINLHTTRFDQFPWKPKRYKKEIIANIPMKVIHICCHCSQNVENSCIFLSTLQTVRLGIFVCIFSISLQTVPPNVIAFLIQNSGELCGSWTLIS